MAYLCINFYETKVPIVRVKTLVNCHPATKVTDRGFLISQFKYWYGIYNGKLIALFTNVIREDLNFEKIMLYSVISLAIAFGLQIL